MLLLVPLVIPLVIAVIIQVLLSLLLVIQVIVVLIMSAPRAVVAYRLRVPIPQAFRRSYPHKRVDSACLARLSWAWVLCTTPLETISLKVNKEQVVRRVESLR